MKKALIAMSGGVDSSVAAALMIEQGYECMGATMKLHGERENAECGEGACCQSNDVEDAKAVAQKLGIPFKLFSLQEDFDEKVIQKFISAYENGSTPNPCVDCNRHLKFQRLFEKAEESGCDVIVTGHYARIEKDEITGRYLLKKGLDESKDQSYVLYSLSQEQLARTRFPLGGFSKEQIRDMARQYGFMNAEKPESQDICFVPDGDYASFIERYTGKKYEKGSFVNLEGEVLGEHKGIIHYTIGQRKGLGISGKEPYYVCQKNPETNTIVLGSEEQLKVKEFEAKDMNWIATEEPTEPIHVKLRTRYHQKEQEAVVTVTAPGKIKIEMQLPVRAPAKGQAVVLYDGDIVVGGGEIC